MSRVYVIYFNKGKIQTFQTHFKRWDDDIELYADNLKFSNIIKKKS